MTPLIPPAAPSTAFNLSAWALRHRPLVLYLICVLAVAGAFAYGQLGQSEDPPFTFKVIVVKTAWPGASAREVEQQVTDRIERKLQELPLMFVRSYSRPGESMIFVSLQDSLPPSAIPELQYQVRKKVGDVRHSLPAGIQGPFFNDEFGDTYTNLYAITGEGYTYRDLKDFGDRVRAELLRVPAVAKVDFIGEQEEKIFIELANARLALLGISPTQIAQTLAAQNAVAAAGAFETPTERIYLRPSGAFDSLDAVRDIALRVNDRLFRLGDIAEVSRGYVDPPEQKMRWRGREALGIGVTMVAGGDVIALGHALDARLATLASELPIGMEIGHVTSMPRAVERSVSEFVRSLAEAVAIVLAVSLISLGLRTGLVVAVAIPLVLATTFLCMWLFGIGLHKISLGALILSLGLLVDDAIIAVEMMAIKLEQGFDRLSAASFAYSSTAFPMLSGTLITVAGFLPIAMAKSTTGEYTRSLFQVSAIALIASWFAAVIVIPYLGYLLLPQRDQARRATLAARWMARWRGLPDPVPAPQAAVHEDPDQVYDTRFYRRFRALMGWSLSHRWIVIGATLAVFVGALAAFRLVPQQFFPSSSRPELIVDLRLPEGSSFTATAAQAQRMESILDGEPGIESAVAYVGVGSPRFYLPLDQQLPSANFAQFVVTAKSVEERQRLRARLVHRFDTDFPGLRGRVTELENGPPVGFPVQFRVSGEDLGRVRAIAQQVMAVVRTDPQVTNAQFDSDEPTKVVRLKVDQNQARVLGFSSEDLAAFLNSTMTGRTVTYVREGDRQIEVVLRGAPAERAQLKSLKDLALSSSNGRAVSITQLAEIRYAQEDGIVWRRDRLPTVTVRSDVLGQAQGPDVAKRIDRQLLRLRGSLPLGYRIEIGGAVEESARGQRSIAAGVPLMLAVVLTLLMIQLQSFSRTLMVLLTAPLGLIGVTAGLLAFGLPFGFVAMLGTIALSGIIMRNAIILVDQIEQDRTAGEPPWDAIIGATTRRFRPIVLTAAAAVLGMIPLTHSAFFGPMAVAMMGGILAATALTLTLLPALYAAWFRVPHGARSVTSQ
ncbi:efflux RND transporter permease subunit [uncultured Thiodictyon sp.]|uniref:efflux RND transporter permease subunit n=1 Tax=uncultured Thiodictyon sp. TaxID=1846217 RepID=UPI0025D8FA9A|nr:efflux RND transporter permease subunit [uncultured Thiodictyon sp.]